MVQNQKGENEVEENFRPWMSDEEIDEIKNWLKKDLIFFEWGCGGSTVEFSKFVKEYYSVEHDFKWYRKVLKNVGGNVNLFYVPPNVLGLEWFPVFNEGSIGEFRDYVKFVNVIGSFDKKFDVVLIDGRARVDCAIEVLPYLKENAIVFIHDFERDYYWDVLKFYKVERVVDKLGVLKVKNGREGVGDRGELIRRFLIDGNK